MRYPMLLAFSAAALFAQRPSNPALLIAEGVPPLDYVATENPIPLPAGVTMGAPAATAFDSKGNMFVLNRGPKSIAEYDKDGKFVRLFVEGMFTRTHGFRIDPQDNFWITDVGGHIVSKLNPQGEVLLTIGTKGQAGEWDEATGSHKLNEPNDVILGRNGDIFVVQGHTPGAKGDPRVLKFDKTGKFIKSWGGKGSAPGKFEVAHGVALDAKGQLWVTDRENQRIQVFDQDGKYIKEVKFNGLPCALQIGPQYIYMVNGFAGQLLRLDLDGRVLAAVGRPGKDLGEFGEAHAITVGPKGEILVADTVNASVQKFVKK